MRIAVTGKTGQVSSALQELTPLHNVEILPLGRPEMDLIDAISVQRKLNAVRPDLVINAAAYTAVDKAEDDEAMAQAVNAGGAGHVARAAADLGIPVFQLSTDYVFDGSAPRPYVEDDAPAPLNAYGRSKLAGERAVALNTRHAIFRTSWVHSPFGPNFVATMLRLARTRPEVTIVADQIGAPTAALDIADALIKAAKKIIARPDDAVLTGIFHLTSAGCASWAEVAQFIFSESAKLGGPVAAVRPIRTAEYPTPARRPANSRLGGTRLRDGYGIELPDWRFGVSSTVAAILADNHLPG